MNTAPLTRTPFRRRRRPWLSVFWQYAILSLVALIVALPILWMVSLAFKTPGEAFGFPPRLFPQKPTLENFVFVWTRTNLPQAFLTSLNVSGLAVFANLALGLCAGYAFARLPFPGREPLFFILLASTMVPIAVTLIPLFLIVKQFPLAGGNDFWGQGGIGLLNTNLGLLIPHMLHPLNIFLARQFFLQLPGELAEAARVDGASEFTIFHHIYLPLARPAMATMAIISFTGAWDDFLWPLVTTTSPELHTVQLALNKLMGGGNIQWGPLMAGATLVTVPVLLVFLFNQRHFVEGLTAGGVKG